LQQHKVTHQQTTDSLYSQAPAPGRQPVPRRRSAPVVKKAIEYESEPEYDEEVVEVVVKHHKGMSLSQVLIVLGILLIGIVLWACVTAYVLPFLQSLRDHWNYGQYRVNYQQVQIAGTSRDTLTVGHNGEIVVIVLAKDKLPAQEYITQQFYGDGKSRVISLKPYDVNNDGIQDLVLDTGNDTDVRAVLYGRKDGTFTWNLPAKQV
jgi:hypothetical protein